MKEALECPVAPRPVSNFSMPGRVMGNGLELLDREQLASVIAELLDRQPFARLELLDREQLASAIGLSERTVSTLKKEKKIPYLALSPRCHKYVLGDVLDALKRFQINAVK
jgi:hypothetical protein